MNNSLQEFLIFANKLADAAGNTSMEYFRTSLSVDNKSDESPVTIADKNTELKIRSLIENKYPDHGILGEEFDNGEDAFIDTAAVMMCCDLIITVDTSIAHLAGALGRPVWTALKYIPDWRWMLNRNDSPWYPTMRLYRQNDFDKWNSVLTTIKKDLELVIEKSKNN